MLPAFRPSRLGRGRAFFPCWQALALAWVTICPFAAAFQRVLQVTLCTLSRNVCKDRFFPFTPLLRFSGRSVSNSFPMSKFHKFLGKALGAGSDVSSPEPMLVHAVLQRPSRWHNYRRISTCERSRPDDQRKPAGGLVSENQRNPAKRFRGRLLSVGTLAHLPRSCQNGESCRMQHRCGKHPHTFRCLM